MPRHASEFTGIWGLSEDTSNYGVLTPSEDASFYWRQYTAGGGEEYKIFPLDQLWVYAGKRPDGLMLKFDFSVDGQIRISEICNGGCSWVFLKLKDNAKKTKNSVFLLHDSDYEVSGIEQALTNEGFQVKSTSKSMDVSAMGIEDSSYVVVIVTKKLIQDPNLTCKYEFEFAARTKKPRRLIAAVPVSEAYMKATKNWSGPVGFKLGGALYVEISEQFDGLINEIKRRQTDAYRSLEGIWCLKDDSTNWGALTPSEDGGFYWKQNWNGGGAEEYKLSSESHLVLRGAKPCGTVMKFDFSGDPNQVKISTDDESWVFLKKTNDQPQSFDFFLSHDWGLDSLERSNHERVSTLNNELKKSCSNPWFDEEQIGKSAGGIDCAMAEGIDNAKLVVIFLTENYIKKVSGKGPNSFNDNCKFEFDYAVRTKGANGVALVMLDPAVEDRSTWTGSVGLHVGGMRPIFVTHDNQMEGAVAALIKRMKEGTTDSEDLVTKTSRIVQSLNINYPQLVAEKAKEQLGMQVEGTIDEQLDAIMEKIGLK